MLDEPTNHLDLDSLDALKAGLGSFRGALLCISHHREFVASIATELWFLRPEHAGAKTASCSRDVAEVSPNLLQISEHACAKTCAEL